MFIAKNLKALNKQKENKVIHDSTTHRSPIVTLGVSCNFFFFHLITYCDHFFHIMSLTVLLQHQPKWMHHTNGMFLNGN